MEKQKNLESQPPEGDKDAQKKELVHDITVMMNEPIRLSMPYGKRLSEALEKMVQDKDKEGRKIRLEEYDIMCNNETVSKDGKLIKDPLLIRASVITLVKKIVGGSEN